MTKTATSHFFSERRLFLFLGCEGAPYNSAQGASYERSYDEYPKVLEGLATSEQGRSDGTGGVDGSSGQPDAYEVYENQGETDGETCEVAGSYLGIRGAENDKDEEEGGDNLNEECSAYSACIGYTIGSETAGKVSCGDNLGEEEKDGSCHDCTDNLATPVTNGILPAETAGEGYTEGDGRVDVASGDTSDRVSHCDNRKTESHGGAYDAGGRVTAKEHCGSAAKEGQNESSDALCKILSHNNSGLRFGVFITNVQ